MKTLKILLVTFGTLTVLSQATIADETLEACVAPSLALSVLAQNPVDDASLASHLVTLGRCDPYQIIQDAHQVAQETFADPTQSRKYFQNCENLLKERANECSPWKGLEISQKYDVIKTMVDEIRTDYTAARQTGRTLPDLHKDITAPVVACVLMRENTLDGAVLEPMILSGYHCTIERSSDRQITRFGYDPSIGLGHMTFRTFLMMLGFKSEDFKSEDGTKTIGFSGAEKQYKYLLGTEPAVATENLPRPPLNVHMNTLQLGVDFVSTINYQGRTDLSVSDLSALELFNAKVQNPKFGLELVMRLLDENRKAYGSLYKAVRQYNGSDTKVAYANHVTACQSCLEKGKTAVEKCLSSAIGN